MTTENAIDDLGAASLRRFTGVATFVGAPFAPDSDNHEIAIVGLPYDFQGGRGSARTGPGEIRNMSKLIRTHSYGGVAPFELCRIADLGDAPMNPFDPKQSIDLATEFVSEATRNGARLIAAGGDHGATYAAVKGLVGDGGPVGLVHFDAHPDTYGDPFGPGFVTHGNAVRLLIEEGYVDAKRTVSVGIHGTRFSTTDRDYHVDAGMGLITIDDLREQGVVGTLGKIKDIVGDGPTYITFDIDVLDPAFAMGTGSPEPGGMTTYEALSLIRGMHDLDIIGGDVMEVAPPFDVNGHTALNAANVMFEITCATALALSRSRQPKEGASA